MTEEADILPENAEKRIKYKLRNDKLPCMEHVTIIEELGRNRMVFRELLSGLSTAEYNWKPQADKWNLLEIICHLYDEEREDFRARTKGVLEDPGKPLVPIDPVRWVTERRYVEQNYEIMIDKWTNERSLSLDWLRSLVNPAWDNVHRHPKLGAMSAGTFLSSWLAHDYLHIRQIVRLKYQHLQYLTGESLDYAGTW